MAVALLLAGTSTQLCASDAEKGTEASGQPATDQRNQEVIVTGHALFANVQPERDLDESAIESYGVSTVDDLLQELQSELGSDDDEPLVLVNGERINDVDEIGAFPIEAVRNAKVLPRGTALRLGGTSRQRVINLTLKKQLRTATLTAAPKFATEGDWSAVRGEAILTHVNGATRANIALRARDEGSLLESDRSLLQPDPTLPYALDGNIVGYPDSAGEIDPSLSAAAGQIVTTAAVPSSGSPTFADFVANVNRVNTTDIGQFRTLRPSSRSYDLNATLATRLAPWLTSSTTLRFNRSESRSLRGLPSALFVIAEGNPASTFTNDVGLALYGVDPLRFRSRRHGGEGSVTLNGSFGTWTANFNAKHSDSTDRSVTRRQASSGAIPLADATDPFSSDPTGLIPLRTDRASVRSTSTLAQLAVTGPVVALPAGGVQATMEGRLAWNSLRSQSTFSSSFGNGDFRRNEQSLRLSLDVPLTSRASGAAGQLGDTSASAEYSRTHLSDAGSIDHYALGLTWEPIPALRLRGSLESTERAPSIQLLGNPVIVTPDVRMFDPLTGQTVDVSQITGGTALLVPQKAVVRRLTALLRLVERLNLQINGEYTDTDIRNFVSSLPDSSAAIMLAFPERFIRNSSGTLTTVDLRPVNFSSDREKRLRWGASMNAKLGGGTRGETSGPDGKRAAARPSTFLQLTASHSIVFGEEIVIRPTLEPVDLLNGGAIGIGGGRVRHQLDGTAALTSGGLGARIGVTWRGASKLESRIDGNIDTLQFSPVLLLNLRAFADANRLLPRSPWTKGLRLSASVLNLTGDRQTVRDSAGLTPLQYQPAYRDPLGRTVEFEIRKVF